jgi:hypothetical protein
MKIGSSPNYLKGEELVYLKCPVISGARKKSHLACNHEAHISPYLWRGVSAISVKLSCHAPAALCGWQAGSLWRADIPPMLAAQTAFPSGPLASFHQKFGQLIKPKGEVKGEKIFIAGRDFLDHINRGRRGLTGRFVPKQAR